MYKSVFIDANILIDYMDRNRTDHAPSTEAIRYLLINGCELCTSCDIMTTLYYLGAKNNRSRALFEIKEINNFCKIVDFSNKEIDIVCQLMEDDLDYHDLEDTLQYILAQKKECELIITNDRKFVAKELKLMSSRAFCESVGVET